MLLQQSPCCARTIQWEIPTVGLPFKLTRAHSSSTFDACVWKLSCGLTYWEDWYSQQCHARKIRNEFNGQL